MNRFVGFHRFLLFNLVDFLQNSMDVRNIVHMFLMLYFLSRFSYKFCLILNLQNSCKHHIFDHCYGPAITTDAFMYTCSKASQHVLRLLN